MDQTPQSAPTNAPTHERVYRTLRTRILHGRITPGEALTLRGGAAELEHH